MPKRFRVSLNQVRGRTHLLLNQILPTPLGAAAKRRYMLRAVRSPNPRSMSSAFSPSVPRAGSTPSCVAAS
jgi:hypothetical protein